MDALLQLCSAARAGLAAKKQKKFLSLPSHGALGQEKTQCVSTEGSNQKSWPMHRDAFPLGAEESHTQSRVWRLGTKHRIQHPRGTALCRRLQSFSALLSCFRGRGLILPSAQLCSQGASQSELAVGTWLEKKKMVRLQRT